MTNSKHILALLLATQSSHAFTLSLLSTDRHVHDRPTSVPVMISRVDLPGGETNDDSDSSEMPIKKFAWDKDPPKTSLAAFGTTHTASPFILNAIEIAHWALIVPAFMGSLAVMQHVDVWMNVLGGDALRVSLFLLAPMMQWVAGLPPIIHHIYEDWQVAPSVLPELEGYHPTDYANERLRSVANTLLLTGQGCASLMQAHAYQGSPLPALLSACVLIYAIVGDKNNLMSNHILHLFNHNKDNPMNVTIVPAPVSSVVFFMYSQITALALALGPLAARVDSVPLKLGIVLPLVFFIIGGVSEGCITEAKFDQRVHLLAVGSFFSAFAVNAWTMSQLGQYLA
ncbi:expressed unknown protein [Seminavis robusta]|uniref:Uncharacterized protein n=1 Tax=Seminavis robusta TaxID=568900 RepID=A0A9N8EG17_9STRA|nr:expressed unknown protein [Seminavis robusta]|eukprot:Sro1025_g232800.1 n/a (341) ;mRNA; f:24075-25097